MCVIVSIISCQKNSQLKEGLVLSEHVKNTLRCFLTGAFHQFGQMMLLLLWVQAETGVLACWDGAGRED